MTTNAEWMLKQGMKFSKLNWGHVNGRNKIYYDMGSYYKELYSEKSVNPENRITKWLDMEHVEPILDDTEKRYLSAFIRPFRDKVKYIKKYDYDANNEFISITFEDNTDDMDFPPFTKGTMYKGMKTCLGYKLEELGL